MSSRKSKTRFRSEKDKAMAIMTGAGRNQWTRKPQTQVTPNRKAEQRRMWCRKGHDDGAVFVFSALLKLFPVLYKPIDRDRLCILRRAADLNSCQSFRLIDIFNPHRLPL